MSLSLGFQVVLNVALTAVAFRIMRPVGMRTLSGHATPAALVVAIEAESSHIKLVVLTAALAEFMHKFQRLGPGLDLR